MKKAFIKVRISTKPYRQRLAFMSLTAFAYLFVLSVQLTHAVGIKDAITGTLKWVGFFAAAVSFVGMILWFSGQLFDLSLKKLVVEFSATLTTGGILTSIQTIWIASRDITNILIIGMFVYIALRKILGKEGKAFNKMIVSLLSVAILINFSFFFTQAVIDFSNWLSIQVYNAIFPESQTSTLSEIITYNMGGVNSLTGMWTSAFAVLKNFDWTSGFSIGGGVLNAVAYLVISSVLSLLAAIMFFRMAFIIIGRWVMFVLLMATSSMAFAAMLMPKKIHVYWQNWYQGLIYNAIVTPLLLLLLWAVTMIMIGVQAAFPFDGVRSSIPNLAAKDAGMLDSFITGLIGFAISIGLLWGAIRIATMLANTAAEKAGKVGGAVSTVLGWGEGLGYRGAFAGAGWAGRNSVGTGFASMGDGIDRHAAKYVNSKNIGKRFYGNLAKGIGKSVGGVGQKNFDGRNTGIAKKFAKSTSTNTGKAIKDGFAKIAEKKEKENKNLTDKAQENINKGFEDDAAIQRENERLEKDLSTQKTKATNDQKQAADALESARNKSTQATTKSAAAEGNSAALQKMAQNTKDEIDRKGKETKSLETAVTEASGKLSAQSAKITHIKESVRVGKDTEALADLSALTNDQNTEIQKVKDEIKSLGTSQFGNASELAQKRTHLQQLQEERNMINDFHNAINNKVTHTTSIANLEESQLNTEKKLSEIDKLKEEAKEAEAALAEKLAENETAKDTFNDVTHRLALRQKQTNAFDERLRKTLIEKSPELRQIGGAFINDPKELATLMNERDALRDLEIAGKLSVPKAKKLAGLSKQLSEHAKVQGFISKQRDKAMMTQEARDQAANDKSMQAQMKKFLDSQDAPVNPATTHNAQSASATSAANTAASAAPVAPAPASSV